MMLCEGFCRRLIEPGETVHRTRTGVMVQGDHRVYTVVERIICAECKRWYDAHRASALHRSNDAAHL